MSTALLEQTITAKTFIHADRQRVFRTLTTAEGWDAWFTRGMLLEAQPGGRMLFRWEQFGPDVLSTSDMGTVQEIQSPELFVFTWHPAGDQYPVEVRMELDQVQSGTMVRLSSTGFPDTERGRFMLLDCSVGWGEALTLLKFYLEYGIVYRGPLASETATQ